MHGVRCLRVFVPMVLASTAFGEAREFNFNDPKDVNAMLFRMDSQLEPIVGYATGVYGKVTFDPEKPEEISGKLTVRTTQIRTTNRQMTRHLHGEDWLNARENRTVDFEFKKVENSESSGGNAWKLTVVGDFTCNGVTKEISVPVTVTHFPGQLGSKVRGKEGDLLVLRSEFTIRRSDFEIGRSMDSRIVGEGIEITVPIVGYWEKE